MSEISRRKLLAGGAALAALPYLSTPAKAADEVADASVPEEGVILIAQLTAKAGEEEAVCKALLAMVAPTREEEGCLCYNLHVSKKDPAAFMFYEQWASQAALDVHSKSDHMKAMQAGIKGRLEEGGATFFEMVR